MPTRNLADACSILQEQIPEVINRYNGRYQHVIAKVGEVLRTAEEQAAKYAQGRTTPGGIVTYADGVNKLSSHQKRTFHGETASHAVDINIFDAHTGEYLGDPPRLYIPLVGLGIAAMLQSGGEWIHPDFPHLYCPYSEA